jgi:hypothetical protein
MCVLNLIFHYKEGTEFASVKEWKAETAFRLNIN